MNRELREAIDDLRHNIQAVQEEIDELMIHHMDELDETQAAALRLMRTTQEIHFDVLSKWYRGQK